MNIFVHLRDTNTLLKTGLFPFAMIPRKHPPLSRPFSHSQNSESKTPVWVIVGLVLVALMGVTYAQVANVTHHPGEIDWAQIFLPLTMSATDTEFLNSIIKVSQQSATSLPGSVSGINADSLDGFDSLAFAGGSGGGVQHAEDTPHSSGEIGDLILGVQNDAGSLVSTNGDYTPLQVDSSGRLRVNAGSITTTQDGEYYYQQCGYMNGGLANQIASLYLGFPSNSSPQQCNDAGGNWHDPDVCSAGDSDLGVDCYPTDIELYDSQLEGEIFIITGMCQRTCQDLD